MQIQLLHEYFKLSAVKKKRFSLMQMNTFVSNINNKRDCIIKTFNNPHMTEKSKYIFNLRLIENMGASTLLIEIFLQEVDSSLAKQQTLASSSFSILQ